MNSMRSRGASWRPAPRYWFRILRLADSEIRLSLGRLIQSVEAVVVARFVQLLEVLPRLFLALFLFITTALANASIAPIRVLLFHFDIRCSKYAVSSGLRRYWMTLPYSSMASVVLLGVTPTLLAGRTRNARLVFSGLRRHPAGPCPERGHHLAGVFGGLVQIALLRVPAEAGSAVP